MEYVTLLKNESFGSRGHFGIEIKVSAKGIDDIDKKELFIPLRKAQEQIESAVRIELNKNDSNIAKQTKRNRDEILSAFDTIIFTKEIPNQYCPQWCCVHLPWFNITTVIGTFIIGWRKRVISIDWSDTLNKNFAKDLFPDEEVTKYDRVIHAYSVEDARKYVEKIMEL